MRGETEAPGGRGGEEIRSSPTAYYGGLWTDYVFMRRCFTKNFAAFWKLGDRREMKHDVLPQPIDIDVFLVVSMSLPFAIFHLHSFAS